MRFNRNCVLFLLGLSQATSFSSAFVVEKSGSFVHKKQQRSKSNNRVSSATTSLHVFPSSSILNAAVEPTATVPVKSILEELANSFSSLFGGVGLPSGNGIDLSGIQSQVQSLASQLSNVNTQVIDQLHQLAINVQGGLFTEFPQVRPIYDKLVTFMGNSPTIAFIVSTFLTYMITSSMLKATLPTAPSSPYPNNNRYDAAAARMYFDQRLPAAISRGLEILVQSLQFGLAVLQDQLSNQKENGTGQFNFNSAKDEQRGKELATLLTKLGPTFIKVGQSLSIRTDLLSPAYIRGLETLQDQVPAFDTAEAKRILEAEWGRPVESVLEGGLPSKPIAAASLGQVYKCVLKETGETVAVKVQRPNILEQIALDMYLLRDFAALLKRFQNLNSDTVATVDAWGAGFVDELDYLQEAQNAKYFNEQISQTPLSEVVFSPTVNEAYSTGTVLVSEWIDGERLDQSSNEDVTVLCSIAMNTYLTMLLEFGLLHCDPHPGNLLRTPDGRLCILDWGMVTRIEPKLQLQLIEHMAHLTSADYGEIPKDLLVLGFIPYEKADLIEDSGVVDVLADIYGAWTAGGGAASIDVNKVISQLQDLTATKGNLFQIPPYFAYIAKSFSVLEGIGLSNQPGKYSIINECLPYVSKRLLSDKDTMGPALSTFIFGPDKTNEDRIVDYKRVKQLVEGFGEYTTSASGALLGKGDSSRTELFEEATETILDLVFTEEETPLQQIFLEQMAKIITANGRYALTELRERSGVLPSGRTMLGMALDPLGLFRTSPLVRTNELDNKTVETTRQLVALMQEQLDKSDNPMFDVSTLSRAETVELSRMLVRKVWERRTGVLQTGGRFARILLQLTADKLEKGERDTRRLPPPRSEPRGLIEQAEEATRQSTPLLSATIARPTSNAPPSARLQGARKLLDSLQKESDTLVPEPVPIRTSMD